VIALDFLISGRVQGVGFRAHTRAQARSLGLVGSALNLADGRVRVHACGQQSQLDELALWLQRGPALARVENVQQQRIAPFAANEFSIG
jgi:acylphosphatase